MKFRNYKIRGYQNPESGIEISRGPDWILLQDNPTDFFIDGLKFIHRSYVIREVHTSYDALMRDVLKLKKIDQSQEIDAQLKDQPLFEYFFQSGKLIQIYQTRQNSTLIGKVVRVSANSFKLRLLGTKGEWQEELSFRYARIRVLKFGTDYLKSFELYVSKS